MFDEIMFFVFSGFFVQFLYDEFGWTSLSLSTLSGEN